VRSQIWQRVTGRCETVTGKRRELDLFITSHLAIPPGVPEPGHRVTERTPRQMLAAPRRFRYLGQARTPTTREVIVIPRPGEAIPVSRDDKTRPVRH